MLHYIKGKLTMRIEGGVVIEAGGLGYEVSVPDNSAVYLAEEGDVVTLYLSMIVREDDVSLYGFSEKEGLALFKQLVTVSGVGAKAAMAILAIGTVTEVRRAIAFEDAVYLTQASGIGKKTAQRIVLELRDKVGKVGGAATVSAAPLESADAGGSRAEAVSALIALGYSRSEAAEAVGRVADDDLSSEAYIKAALKNLF